MTIHELWQLIFKIAGAGMGISFAAVIVCMTIGLLNGWIK